MDDFYLVRGNGNFFSKFIVMAKSIHDATAKASDILAGSDHKEPLKGRRFYNTVETHIISIEKIGNLTDVR